MTRKKNQDLFRNILLVYSPTGLNTLKSAAQIAQSSQARLTIIDIASGLDDYRGFLPPDISEQDLMDTVSAERRMVIEEQVKTLGGDRDGPDIRVRFGKAAIEIIRDVMAYDHDLVMKTAIGGAGLAERLFGNTAMKLIRKCPSPVWIAHPEGPPALQRVLAAIDPMPTAERSEQLNRRILESASQMARMGAGHLDILHCWHLPGESTMSFGRTRISPAKLKRMRDMAEKVHRRKVVDLVERMRLTGLSVKLHVIHGDPTASVLAFAEQAKSDLIVIGTADKSALAGLLMGSTAENIVEKSRTSVLAIKPEEFVSPIKPR